MYPRLIAIQRISDSGETQIAISSMDSVIQRLSNWGQYSRFNLSQLLHIWKELLPPCTIDESS